MKKLIIALLFLSIGIQAQKWEGYVTITGVHDGDGSYYGIHENGHKVQLRLRGVDCPEIYSRYVMKTQPYGVEAGNSIRALLKDKKVYVICFGKSFERDVCDITYYEDSLLTKSKSLATTIVGNGLGWHDGNNYGMKIPKEYKRIGGLRLMREAKRLKLGLWQNSEAINPIVWRKMYRAKK